MAENNDSRVMDTLIRQAAGRGSDLANRLSAPGNGAGANTFPIGNAGSGLESRIKSVDIMNQQLRLAFLRKGLLQ